MKEELLKELSEFIDKNKNEKYEFPVVGDPYIAVELLQFWINKKRKEVKNDSR